MAVASDAVPHDVEDSEVLARCRAGDRLAFRALYDLHFRRVHHTARCLGTPPSELDDVTQEVFAHAFANLSRFHGGHFGHWIHRICANVVTDHHRRRRVRDAFRRATGQVPQVDSNPGPEANAGRAEAERQVASILAKMRPKHREVFALFELEGLSGDEIAQRVGCPVNTVWTRLHHARAAFTKIGKKRGFIEEEGA